MKLIYILGLFSPAYFKFSSVQFSSVQFNSVQFSSDQISSDQFNSVQFSSWQYFYSHISLFISVRFSSDQFRSVQFNSVQFSSAVLCRREQTLYVLIFPSKGSVLDLLFQAKMSELSGQKVILSLPKAKNSGRVGPDHGEQNSAQNRIGSKWSALVLWKRCLKC